MSSSLDDVAAAKLRALERRRLRRHATVSDRGAWPRVSRPNGMAPLSFSCNDYLGLSTHPDVVAAGIDATRRYGAGAGASRLITGDHPLYAALEERLAALKGSAAAIVFGSGYLANVGTLQAIAGPPDLLLVDELSHACIAAGAALSGARVRRFAHNDAGAADSLLAAHRTAHRHCVIVTEGVFSMDGDIAPLPALADVAARHDAWLMTDDAHALGVLGGGRGSSFAFEPPIRVPLQMGTLSKAVGGYGGYVCASEPVVEWLRNRAQTVVYSTGLPPGVVAAASAALDLIAAQPQLAEIPVDRARRFAAALRAGAPEVGGAVPEPRTAIVPLVVGSVERALALSRALENRGFLVVPIRPPTVPAGTARLRFAFSAAHTESDVDAVAAATVEALRA